jgi:hypothetical protein
VNVVTIFVGLSAGMTALFDNYTRIAGEIDEEVSRRGGNPGDVTIVAVSKTVTAEVVREAIGAGLRIFGENRVQEAKSKIDELGGNYSFHLVGHLQSNKARDAVKLFELIHSIDKDGTAARVDEEARRIGKVQKVLVQVNTSGEDTKSGVAPADAEGLCRAVLGLRNIELTGLMTIGPFTDDEKLIRASFVLLRELRDGINLALGCAMVDLSMGMSSDYRIAVQEGATIVRIGTSIFGQRT